MSIPEDMPEEDAVAAAEVLVTAIDIGIDTEDII